MMTHAAYDCDVLVIGGGIVGLSTAYALTRTAPGTRVTVRQDGFSGLTQPAEQHALGWERVRGWLDDHAARTPQRART